MRIEQHGLEAMIARTVRFGVEGTVAARAGVHVLGDEILARADARVHRVTGNLAATGRVVEVGGTLSTFEAEVVYGGIVGIDRFVDYAGYEETLHPYLTPSAVEATAGGSALLEGVIEEAARVAVRSIP